MLSRLLHPFLPLMGLIISLMMMQERVSAQNTSLAFEHYTTEHGLSAPVMHIVQDKYGFIWLGTTDGLNRFDGINFIVYRNIPGDPNSLPSNIINAIHVDKAGRIWVATNGGLSYYDFTDDKFHPVAFDATIEKLDQYRVHAVTSSSDNAIWFATRSNLHQWRKGTLSKPVPLSQSSDYLVKYISMDAQDRIWIGSNAGLHVYLPSDNSFLYTKIESPFSRENNLGVTVHPVVPTGGDTVLTGSWYADLQKVFVSGGHLIAQSFANPSVTDPRSHIVSGISEVSENQWWVGTYGAGISWFDSKKKSFTGHFSHDPSNAKSLSSNYINDLYTDNSGITWVGTSKGLDKFDPLTQQFQSVTIPVQPNQFAVYRLANTIVEDKDNQDYLWLCVSGVGLFHYNKHTHQFELFQFDTEEVKNRSMNNIYSFYYDREGRAWIGTKAGLLLFDAKTKKFMPSPLPVAESVNGTHTILEDNGGNFWFATHSQGITRFNEANKSIIHYKHDASRTSIPDNRVFCMMRDSEGMIWLGTQNRGLCRLDPGTGQYLFFEHVNGKENTIPDNGVYDIYEDANRQLWIGTENGFASMDLETFKFTNYSTNEGLCNNTVFSITPANNNNFWLGTNNGLSNFDLKTRQFRNYYAKDGLPFNRVDGEVFITRDTTLYFGTAGMLSFCKPEEMEMNKRVPSIIITDFSILGKKVPVMRTGEMLQPIHLNHKQNMITFNFAALNFTNAFLNQYAYKLEGFDEAWIPSGSTQSATYTNLSGGEYVFRVKAANNDGVWNETGTNVLLYVHPPFWKTWWFYTLCLLAIVTALYILYKFRINQIMRLQNIRTRIARDLHDDIGSTLSSINMISSMADKPGTEKKTSELFSTISTASSQAMELMSDIVWSINPNNDRMEMIITRMRQYASEILEAADISFSLEFDENSKDVLLPLEMRKDFYLIFKEAVNNLAKYSGAQHAIIRLWSNHHDIYLHVEDDGKGFSVDAVRQGNGLKNMKARTDQLKGAIQIKSSPGAGTKIDLKVPLSP